MVKQRQIRHFQDESKVAQLCGFDTKDAFRQWTKSQVLFRRSWNTYHDSWLKPQREKTQSEGSSRRKKEATFNEVTKRIAAGEAGGSRKYSKSLADTPVQSWDGADWLAWLLLELVQANTSDKNGIFYQKGLPIQNRQDAMWQVIQRYLWMSTSSRKTRSMDALEELDPDAPTISATPNPPAPQVLSEVGGEVKIYWQNMPRTIEDSGAAPLQIYISNMEDIDWDGFRERINRSFKLEDLKLRTASLNTHESVFAPLKLRPDEPIFDEVDESTFTDLQEYSLRTKDYLQVNLRTAEVVNSLLNQNLEEDRPNDFVQPYDLMVQESSPQFDETQRFWKWARLRNVSRVEGEVAARVTGVTVAPEEINTEQEALLWLRYLDASNSQERGSSTHDHNSNVKLHDITDEEIAKYREVENFLGNLDYERQGRTQACEALGIPNPQRARIPGMRLSTFLEAWQPGGIKALVDFEDGPLGGGVLADLVGLGKTWQSIGLLQFRLNERRQKIKNGIDTDRAKPTLLIVPANLIGQWVEEIDRVTPEFTIKVYYSSKLIFDNHVAQKISKILDKDNPLFNGNEETANVIVITSYNTFRNRHGPTAYKNYLIKQAHEAGGFQTRAEAKRHVEETEFKTMPADHNDSWPRGLSGCFERVILDEGHEIRNRDTFTWTSIRWIRAKHRIIATATPLIESVKDFAGLLALLQPRDDLWTEESLEQLGAFSLVPKIDPESDEENPSFNLNDFLTRFDPWDYEDHSAAQVLKQTHESFMEHIVRLKASHHIRGSRIRSLLNCCVIRRTYNSKIDGVPIGKHLPLIQKNIVECNMTNEERIEYNEMLEDALDKLHRKSGNDIVWDTNVYRRLLLCGTWLKFKWLLHYRVKKLKEFRKTNNDALNIIKDVSERQLKSGVDTSRLIKVPQAGDKESIMREFTTDGPKIRALAQLVADLAIMLKEKTVVWCSLPAIQLFLEKFLVEAGVDARSFHANLSLDERRKLSDDFNNSDEVHVLIASYYVSVSGLNWQKQARNCLFFDPPPSKGLEDQALGRVYRVGQQKWVRLIRLDLAESFEDKIVSRNIVRALPGLMTELNMEVFGDSDNEDRKNRLGKFALVDGDLISFEELPATEASNVTPLEPDVLLVYIHKLLRGEPLKLTKEDEDQLKKIGTSTAT